MSLSKGSYEDPLGATRLVRRILDSWAIPISPRKTKKEKEAIKLLDEWKKFKKKAGDGAPLGMEPTGRKVKGKKGSFNGWMKEIQDLFFIVLHSFKWNKWNPIFLYLWVKVKGANPWTFAGKDVNYSPSLSIKKEESRK